MNSGHDKRITTRHCTRLTLDQASQHSNIKGEGEGERSLSLVKELLMFEDF